MIEVSTTISEFGIVSNERYATCTCDFFYTFKDFSVIIDLNRIPGEMTDDTVRLGI